MADASDYETPATYYWKALYLCKQDETGLWNAYRVQQEYGPLSATEGFEGGWPYFPELMKKGPPYYVGFMFFYRPETGWTVFSQEHNW